MVITTQISCTLCAPLQQLLTITDLFSGANDLLNSSITIYLIYVSSCLTIPTTSVYAVAVRWCLLLVFWQSNLWKVRCKIMLQHNILIYAQICSYDIQMVNFFKMQVIVDHGPSHLVNNVNLIILIVKIQRLVSV